MSQSIFRQTALDRLSTPDQLDQALQVANPTGWFAVAAVAFLVAAALAWGIVGTAPVKVQGNGILLSTGGMVDVVPASEGRVAWFLVEPGDTVTIGQVVAVLEQPDIERDRETASAELKEVSAQFEQIRQFNERDLRLQAELARQKTAALRQSIAFLEDRVRWLKEREAFEGDLFRKQIINRQRTIDTKIEINDALDQIAKAQNAHKQIELEESAQRVAKEREILQFELQVSKLRRQVESLTERLERRSTVTSPYSGRVVELKINPGEIVGSHTALFNLIPDGGPTPDQAGNPGGLVVVLYVPPEHGKKVQPGMEVQVAPSTVRREEYGFMLGRVRRVAEVPASEEGMMRSLKNRQLAQELAGKGAPFEVVVDLLPDPEARGRYRWSSARGPEVPVNAGTLCEGAVTVRSIHLISLIIPALESLFRPREGA